MAPISFFLILFILHSILLLPLHSAHPDYSQCPSFSCGNFCEVNCTDEYHTMVKFPQPQKWYGVEFMNWYLEKISIHDQDLQDQLDSNRCGLLANFTVPVSPSVKFSDESPEFPFFRCKRKDYHDGFFPSIQNFTGCSDDYVLYFTGDYKKSLPLLPDNFSNLCSTVKLPVPWDVELLKPETWWNPSTPVKELTSLWTATYFLSWDILPDCYRNQSNGGLCLDANGNFQCGGSKNNNGHKGRKIAIVGGAAILTTLVIIFCILTRKLFSNKLMPFSKKKTGSVQNVEAFLMNHGSLSPRRYRYADIKKMTNSFKHKLGQGGYGSVFKGRLLDGRMIAVKLLSESKGNGEEFINEVASISRTSHINVVTLIGFCVEGNKRALIYEFMSNGSLEKFIYDKINHLLLGWKTLYEIALGIARGLEYLHRGCNTRILHFDIKPHNILLDQDFCPKISDFGLSKLCLAKESIISMTGARGTAGYIAPELISRNFGAISHKSDVYSYGMMVLEIVGGRKNVDARAANSSQIYFPQWIYNHLDQSMDLGLQGVTTAEDEKISRKMVLVGLWCIQIDPSNRPSMNKVLDMLVGSLEELQIPPKPFLSSPPIRQEDLSSISISSSPRPNKVLDI